MVGPIGGECSTMALADWRHVGNRQADGGRIYGPEETMGNTKVQSPINLIRPFRQFPSTLVMSS